MKAMSVITITSYWLDHRVLLQFTHIFIYFLNIQLSFLNVLNIDIYKSSYIKYSFVSSYFLETSLKTSLKMVNFVTEMVLSARQNSEVFNFQYLFTIH